MHTQPGFQPPNVASRYVFVLRAIDLEGNNITPIPCVSEQEVNERIDGLTALGYLDPRVTIERKYKGTR